MGKNDATDIQAALRTEFKDATTVSLLGGTFRRNSFTYVVTRKNSEKVVVKVLKNSAGSDSKINDERQSLKAIAHLADMRVSRLIGAGDLKIKTRRMPYLVFPFYEGSTLGDLVDAGKFSEEATKQFITEMAGTLLLLGENGIIHQDVKPDNIIRLPDGTYVLLDLGIARFTKLEPALVKQQGPAAYLSMEQIQLGTRNNMANKRRITFMSDLNSLGIVALNMLLSRGFRSGWEIDRRHEASLRIRQGEMVKIHDPELREMLASLLEASPATRFVRLRTLLDLSAFEAVTDSAVRHWALHKANGLTYLDEYAEENPDDAMGLVLTGETVKSVSNTGQIVDRLLENEWEVTVDPSTHKLLYNAGHHGSLKGRQYYIEDLDEEQFLETGFSRAFASQVVEFERSLNPTRYISPYFYINKSDESRITLGLNLYGECRRNLNLLGDSRELLFGLNVSKRILAHEDEIDTLSDQLMFNDSYRAIYLNIELTKRDNAPCGDEKHLAGLLRLVERLASTKQVIIAGGDQSCLGLLTMPNVAIAINPSVSFRKNDIEDKLKEERGEGGGPKPEDKRHRVYIPPLLNDLDIRRDLGDPAFQVLNADLNLDGQIPSPYYTDALNIGDNAARNKHFIYTFRRQVERLSMPEADAKKAFGEMVRTAKEAYAKIDDAAIKLDRDSTGDFLAAWENVML